MQIWTVDHVHERHESGRDDQNAQKDVSDVIEGFRESLSKDVDGLAVAQDVQQTKLC